VEGSRCGYLVNPLNPEDIAEKVATLLSDEAKRREMGENGRRAHEEVYNWQVEEQKLLQLYQELA
jgi:glycosyltransferase involved in cell wall biosynthesis